MVDIGRRRLVLVTLLAILIVVVSAYNHWQRVSAPAPVAVEQLSSPEKPEAHVVVYVSGAVVNPGIYKVPPTSRVVDVIEIAGGLAAGADVNKVNMAKPVKDGMQVNVPLVVVRESRNRTGSASAARGETDTAEKRVSWPININNADQAELAKLPGVGPVTAQRIIEYRTVNGPFKTLAELMKVSGIGEQKYNQLKDKISLD